ncbi:MAG: SpoIIE family protein phosphatase [Candidatus Sumerlaeota bacterium]|nr:SpoIIE family protein phosphatase [Candidatus Sumerlaeota bacterium]
MARLVVSSGPDEGLVYSLVPGVLTIGRSPDNAIQVVDKKSSRQHAELRVENGAVTLRDLGSKNGTLLNGDKLQGEVRLHSGDKILIGETTLVFERSADEAPCDESTSKSVRLVADLPWGHEKGTMAAGVRKPAAAAAATAPVPAESVKDATRRLQIICQISDAIRTTYEVDPLLDIVMESLFSLLGPDRAFILLYDETSTTLVPRATRLREPEGEDIAVSRVIIDHCLQDRVSVLVSDALSDVRFKASKSIHIQKIRSAICAPMICQDDVMGVIYFDTKNRPAAYDQAELEFATSLANQTAMALANIRLQERAIKQRTLEREMEIARDIQTRLLPRSMPKTEDFEFAAISVPAQKVGGDYYDLLQLPDGRIGVAIADVSGKGVPAAILIASVRSALQAEGPRTDASAAEVLEHLNDLVYHDTAVNMFVTMVYGILNPKTRVFEYANAGHPYPLLFAPDGGLTELETGGCFLGISPKMAYVKGLAVLPPGGTLLLYSDGVSDTLSPAGELYGRKRLVELVRANLHLSARELRDLIYHDTQQFQKDAEQFDDISVVVIRNTEAAG